MDLKKIPQHVSSKIEFEEGACWTWIAGKSKGYGTVGFNGKVRKAHRVIYELLVGQVPKGLTLDHLCRNRACVNPAHLEPATHRENILRGVCNAADNARKTHCKRGHELTSGNLVGNSSKKRECLTCHNAAATAWKAANREQVRASNAAYKRRIKHGAN